MIERSKADGVFKVSLPEQGMGFTGERMTTAAEGEIEFEHFHRYCLARDLCSGLDVLDVASGEGYGSSILADVARSVTGVDVDPEAVAHARTTYGKENLRFIHGSVLALPLDDASVDAIVSFETLEHVREHVRFMAEVKRVLRGGGHLIVSTPERAIYSARGEPVNKFHLLELTEAEFESLLRANFKHVEMLSQRAVLGSVMVKPEGGGAWRSYERRSLDYIEASGGLARAPFLIGIASDEELEDIPSTVYLDRRRPAEVVGAFLQLPAYQSQAAAHGAEIGRLNEAAARRDAEMTALEGRLNQVEARREAEVTALEAETRRLTAALSARDGELSAVKAEHDAKIAWLNQERNADSARLASLQDGYDKLTRSFRWRFVDGAVHFPRAASRSLRWPFMRVTFHKNGRPRGWLRRLGFQSKATVDVRKTVSPTTDGRVAPDGQEVDPAPGERRSVQTEGGPGSVFDDRKATILIVSHEASRSGAPILALNLVQKLSARYNVVTLILGPGELLDEFRRAAALLFAINRFSTSPRELDGLVNEIATRYALTFAIANTVESRAVLQPLKARGVPTVSLVHEFSSYMRPRSAFPEVLTLSTEIVFSTRITLENAIEEHWIYPGPSIHVVPQGKCVVPAHSGASVEASNEKDWLARSLRPARESRQYLVIGVGRVELRKGVDIFIECASFVKKQSKGDRFRFVWIGDGFDPDNDMYSGFLADQIKRADLESNVTILRPTSEIEFAYRSADLLLVSSRLDPLPNVAIDALLSGLPVICFERTTGIADFLVENSLGEPCVARYLDAHDLAQKVLALADSDQLRADVAERSSACAKSAFDMEGYVSKIETIAAKAVGAKARTRNDVDAIIESGKFRSDFFMHPAVQSLRENELIEDYLRRTASGFRVRKPMPGFQPIVYSELKRRGENLIGDPFVDFLQKGEPKGPWLYDVIREGHGAITLPTRLNVALHLHVFYEGELDRIIERLKMNAAAPDLFVSVVSKDLATRAEVALVGYPGRTVDLQVTPNLGRDIGPLLTQFGQSLCSSYDIVGHVHTKKSAHVADRPVVEAWIDFLLENVLGGRRSGAMLDSILSAMVPNPSVGIVFPDDPNVMSWTGNRKHAEMIASRMKVGPLPEQFNFPIGSMFWARSAILKKFVELEFAWANYEPEPLPADGTIIHAIERLFGVVPPAMGMTCAVTNVRGVTR